MSITIEQSDLSVASISTIMTLSDAMLYDKLLILDTETTGMSVHDEIIEFALVAAVDGETLVHKYYMPTVPINYGAKKCHGMDKKFLLDNKAGRFDAEELLNLLKVIKEEQVLLTGWNLGFDIRMMEYTITKYGTAEQINIFHELIDGMYFDMMEIVKGITGTKLSQSKAADALGVTLEGRVHTAAADCNNLRNICIALINLADA